MSRRTLGLPDRRPAGWRWIGSTSLVGGIWALFAAANISVWSSTHRPVGLGAITVACVVVVLFIVRRQPLTVSRSPLAWIVGAVGSFGLTAERPHFHPVGGLDYVYQGLQIGGAVGATFALISLGRSFGVVAANRGIETRGAYRFVRHPVYSCYLMVDTGYLLENPSRWNAVVFLAVIVAQLARIWQEERCLSADPVYAEYRQRVRHRLVPYVI